MVNLFPGFISTVFYASAAFVIRHTVKVPENLKKKEEKDFLGQHLSILHAYASIIGCSAVYIYEGGIDYNSLTNQYHEWVILVILT